MLPIVYPSGLQAICVKPTEGGRFRHVWVDAAFAGSAAGEQYLDAFQEVNRQGENIYFSIASFMPGQEYDEFVGRRQANTLGCIALAVDLDYLKHERDAAWAQGLLDAICTSHGLPATTLRVDTGGGLHGYWHFDIPRVLTQWLPWARRLGALFGQVNQQIGARVIDTQCTVDIARVLRVPGFINHKYAHKPVVQVTHPMAAPLAWETMEQALQDIDPGALPTAAMPVLSLGLAAGFVGSEAAAGSALRGAFADVQVSEPASWQQLRDKSLMGLGCEVLRQVLADNNVAGYETWAGLLSVVQHTDGGDEALLAISGSHRDFGRTVSLLDCRNKARTFHSPRTCAAFAEHMPQACAGCPNNGKIKSPILLGRGGVRIERDAPPAPVQEVSPPGPPPPAPVISEEHVLVPPAPECSAIFPPVDKMFRYRDKTSEVEMRQDTDTPGVSAWGVIINRPVWLKHTIDNRVCLAIYDMQMREHTREFDASKLLAGGDWGPLVAWLTFRGVHPAFTTSKTNPAQHPLIMFIKSLIHRYGAERAIQEVDHFGPSTEVRPRDFVLGTTRYTTDGAPPTEVQIAEGSPLQEHVAGMVALPPEESLQAAQQLCARMAPIYAGPDWAADRFIIMASLSACLSPFVIPREMQGGVMVVSSPTSGEAKSSTLTTAAALYTRNTNTIKRSNATHTAVFKTLLPRLNAVPLMLDDWDKQVRTGPGHDLAGALTDLLVQSTNLRPKALANGEVTPGWWSTWLFLATNSDVAEAVCRTETGGAAAGMRFLEIPIPPRQHIDTARQEAYEAFRYWREEHGGQTAHCLLRTVLPHMPHLVERYAYWMNRIRLEHTGGVLMAARFLRAMVACTLTGGEAAAHFGLLPFDVEEAYAYGAGLIKRQLQVTGTMVADNSNILSVYLAANVGKVLNLTTPARAITASTPEIAAVVERGDQVLIPCGMLHDWLKRTGRSTSHLLAKLQARFPDAAQDSRPIPVAGLTLHVRCYVVTMPGISSQLEAGQPPTGVAPVGARPLH